MKTLIIALRLLAATVFGFLAGYMVGQFDQCKVLIVIDTIGIVTFGFFIIFNGLWNFAFEGKDLAPKFALVVWLTVAIFVGFALGGLIWTSNLHIGL